VTNCKNRFSLSSRDSVNGGVTLERRLQWGTERNERAAYHLACSTVQGNIRSVCVKEQITGRNGNAPLRTRRKKTPIGSNNRDLETKNRLEIH